MGVDHEAHYGIGVPIPRNEVKEVLGDEDHDYGDELDDYIYEKVLVLPRL